MKQSLVLLLTAFLAACGGGSSSGGAGQSGSHAGTYNGFARATMSAPGVAPETATGTIQFVIDNQGNVTSDPNTRFSGRGKVTGSTFTVNVPAAKFNQPGITCTGFITIRGNISGSTVKGSLAANKFRCNNTPIKVNGSFEANRVADDNKNARPVGTTVMESLSTVLY